MNYAATDFSSRSLNEQKALTLFFCNLFSTQSRRWLLYFSEWTSEEGELTSNAQVDYSNNCFDFRKFKFFSWCGQKMCLHYY